MGSASVASRNITVYDSGFKGSDIHVDDGDYTNALRAETSSNSHDMSFSDTRTSLNASMALASDTSSNSSGDRGGNGSSNVNSSRNGMHLFSEDSAFRMAESAVQDSSPDVDDNQSALSDSHMSYEGDRDVDRFMYLESNSLDRQMQEAAVDSGRADWGYLEGIEVDEDLELQTALAMSLSEEGQHSRSEAFAERFSAPMLSRLKS